MEDKKKKKATEYFRTLFAHREEFFRFHKNKRIGNQSVYEEISPFFFPVLLRVSSITNPFVSILSLSNLHPRL